MGFQSRLQKLIEVGSDAIAASPAELKALGNLGAVGEELAGLLKEANGFFAFESALLIRPTKSVGPIIGLDEWNASDRWRDAFEGMADGLYFFAEDVLGGQFGIGDEGVFMFDPDAGDRELISPTLEGWAEEVLSDFNFLTAYPLAHAWQVAHGRLLPGQRLAPKIPFVFGGLYDISNLYLVDSANAMLARASIAVQVRDQPDGVRVELTVVD